MPPSDKEHLQNLITTNDRRLKELQKRQALKGINTEPEVNIEIEDIKAKIKRLQAKIDALPELIRLNPYRGLSAFRPEDADVFFGRGTFTVQLVERVQQKPLVAVLGPSGSGKSSTVFAGLIPALENDEKNQWLVADFRPGSDPFMGLASALVRLLEPGLSKVKQIGEARDMASRLREKRSPLSDYIDSIHQIHTKYRLLLIADQFEELYTLTQETTTHQQFLDLLLTAVDLNSEPAASTGFQLLLTLRVDFLGQALLYPPFRDVLQDNISLLGSMSIDKLRAVIEKPAHHREVSLEPGLVERILDDVESEPGNLPLLEFALTQLWEQQKDGDLTHAAYNDIGQVEGALSRHADKVFENLSEDDQEQARRLFLRLVQPGEGTEDTRRLATKVELGEISWGLAQRLADERLVVTNRNPDEQETVEVAHEALIRGWTRLQSWIDADRSFLNWQKRLRFAMGQWQVSEQDEGALLRGALLDEAEKYLKDRGQDLGKGEYDYIQASITLREGEEHREKDYKKLRLVSEILARGGQDRDLREANLREANLREANLSGANLSRANLEGAILSRANLSRANLSGANLREANMSEANLSEADLSEADLSRADLRQADLSGADLREANLREANLREANLSGANLSGANLSGANLRGANLRGADLRGADLRGADLRGADLRGADLRGADLRQAKIDDETQLEGKWRLVWEIVNQRAKGRDLRKANLREVKLRGANLSRANLSRADLREANLSRANLSWADLSWADLREANLSWADLREAKIDDETQLEGKWRLVWKIVNQGAEGRDLRKANLREVKLSGANLREANLSWANLSGADLSWANLREADLSGANLNGANLSWADLREANLREANLREAKIDDETQLEDKWRLVWRIVNQGAEGRDLRGADLSGADLSRTFLWGVDLRGANLRGANLEGATLWRAKYNSQTIWSMGFDPDEAGAKLVED